MKRSSKTNHSKLLRGNHQAIRLHPLRSTPTGSLWLNGTKRRRKNKRKRRSRSKKKKRK